MAIISVWLCCRLELEQLFVSQMQLNSYSNFKAFHYNSFVGDGGALLFHDDATCWPRQKKIVTKQSILNINKLSTIQSPVHPIVKGAADTVVRPFTLCVRDILPVSYSIFYTSHC